MANEDRARRFVELLAECDRKLYAYVLALVGSFPDADDIIQETKIRLWEQFSKQEPTTSFYAWARKIAHYQVLTFRRKSQRDRLHFSMNIIDDIVAAIDERPEALEEQQVALAECIKQETEESQSLLRMVYESGVPIKEVAEKIGRSLAATYQVLWRIRRSLEKCIQRRLSEGAANE